MIINLIETFVLFCDWIMCFFQKEKKNKNNLKKINKLDGYQKMDYLMLFLSECIGGNINKRI